MDARIDPSLIAEIDYRRDRARRHVEHGRLVAVAREARRRTRRARTR